MTARRRTIADSPGSSACGAPREPMTSDKQRKPRPAAELTLQLDTSTLAERMRDKPRRRASLLVIGGIDVGNIIPLELSRVVLGRDPECGGILRDDGISREHAEVVREGPDRFLIRDLGSTNGIFVGGERVGSHELSDGDKVLFGRRTILKFVLQDALEMEFQQQMYRSAVRDALTGAFNRKHFDERITAELSYASRHNSPVSLLMIDLDRFKRINDTFGHIAGDQVLKSVAAVIAETIRAEDVFARYGGEEFVVIAREVDAIGGLALGERLRRLVEEMRVLQPDGERILVTISVGVATAPRGAVVKAAALVKRADENLYAAKRGGRNRVEASMVET
jgi:diguanylate cyclase (GGDEF)-like protein